MRIQPFMQAPLLTCSTGPVAQLITVAEGETKKALWPDILHAGRLEECIVVALYDRATDDRATASGYMCRSSAFEENSMLEQLIETAKRDYGDDLSRLQVFVYGGGLTDPHATTFMVANLPERDIADSITDSQKYVERLLESHFKPKKIYTIWIKAGMRGEVQLDTATGKLNAEVMPLDEGQKK